MHDSFQCPPELNVVNVALPVAISAPRRPKCLTEICSHSDYITAKLLKTSESGGICSKRGGC